MGFENVFFASTGSATVCPNNHFRHAGTAVPDINPNHARNYLKKKNSRGFQRVIPLVVLLGREGV